jgi:pimeloyl-ACP methyl ester carboxylesterase
MQLAEVDGITLEYEERGSGDPVVFIHGSHIAEGFAPLMREPSLDGFRLIRYHRRGFAGSSRHNGPLSISGQAADCLGLLRHLGIDRVHVVGHSYGAVTALQFTLDAPNAVRSLSLLEPPLFSVPSAEQAGEALAATAELYAAGDKAGAVDTFMQAICGQHYRTPLDTNVPGGLQQAIDDADTAWAIEFPALQEWAFTKEDAARIHQPVLAVLGADSDKATGMPFWSEGHQLLREWLPQAKPLVLPRAAHLLQMENPHDMAEGLAAFLATVPPEGA